MKETPPPPSTGDCVLVGNWRLFPTASTNAGAKLRFNSPSYKSFASFTPCPDSYLENASFERKPSNCSPRPPHLQAVNRPLRDHHRTTKDHDHDQLGGSLTMPGSRLLRQKPCASIEAILAHIFFLCNVSIHFPSFLRISSGRMGTKGMPYHAMPYPNSRVDHGASDLVHYELCLHTV